MQHKEQKEYYSAEREHRYLRYSPNDSHARNLIAHLIAFGNIAKSDAIMEMGCGSGRFSLHLLKAGFDLTCVDISESQIARLKEDAGKEGVRQLKVRSTAIENIETDKRYDAIIGFFILHHLDVRNMAAYFLKFRKLLKPDGKICFVEPNRLNPLFLLQMMMERDIDFCYEKGLFVLSRRLLKKALVLSDFKKIAFRNFGFSPPQIINHFPAVLRIEKLLEDTPVLKRILPFLLVKAEV